MKIKWTRIKYKKKLFCNAAQVDLNRFEMNQDHEEEVKGMIENPLMKQMFIIISQIIVGSKSNLLARAWKHLNHPVKIFRRFTQFGLGFS